MTKEQAEMYIDRAIKEGCIPFNNQALTNGVGVIDDKWYFIAFGRVIDGVIQDSVAIIDIEVAEARFPNK